MVWSVFSDFAPWAKRVLIAERGAELTANMIGVCAILGGVALGSAPWAKNQDSKISSVQM